MAYWYRITPQGELDAHDRKPTLEQLQQAVGGDIEVVPMMNLPLELMILCNEQPENERTVNFIANFITSIRVVGTIVVIGPADEDGEFTPVPARYDMFLRGFASVVNELRELHRAGLTVQQ